MTLPLPTMTWSMTGIELPTGATPAGMLKAIWNLIDGCTHWDNASGDPDQNNDGTGVGGVDYLEIVNAATTGDYHEQSITLCVSTSTEPPQTARRVQNASAQNNYIMVNYCINGTNINRTGQSGQWRTSSNIYDGCPTVGSTWNVFATSHTAWTRGVYAYETEECLIIVLMGTGSGQTDCTYNFFGPFIQPVTSGIFEDDRIYAFYTNVRRIDFIRAVTGSSPHDINTCCWPNGAGLNAYVWANASSAYDQSATAFLRRYTTSFQNGESVAWVGWNHHFQYYYSTNHGLTRSNATHYQGMGEAYFLRDRSGRLYLKKSVVRRGSGSTGTAFNPGPEFIGELRQIHDQGVGFRRQVLIDANNNAIGYLVAPSETTMFDAIILSNT